MTSATNQNLSPKALCTINSAVLRNIQGLIEKQPENYEHTIQDLLNANIKLHDLVLKSLTV